jgi:tRNA1Val (adenine37-N6)-methyltransferase
MSSINQKYTFQYSQPDEYHFSHDSVFLAQFVFDWLLKNPDHKINQIADLCAGCGIIGMDLLFHLNQEQLQLPLQTDFVEVQHIYESHFEKNKIELKKHIHQKSELNFVNANYADLVVDENFKSKYDLIICNPPYFKTTQGKLSPSEFKNRCRFFIDSDFLNLMQFVKHSMTKTGRAFILLRSLKDHGENWDLPNILQSLGLRSENMGEIRGTDVVMVRK